jgi:hypothetical protein
MRHVAEFAEVRLERDARESNGHAAAAGTQAIFVVVFT